MAEDISLTLSRVREFKSVFSVAEFLDNLDIPISHQNFLQYFQEVLICSNTPIDFGGLQAIRGPQTSYQFEILVENISGLLSNSRSNYIQVFGYRYSGGKLSCQLFNMTNKILISEPFEYLLSLVGDQLMLHMLKNFLIFKTLEKRFYLQLCGPIIIDYFNHDEQVPKPIPINMSWFQNYTNKKINKIQELKKEFHRRINRNLIFFCPHINRQPGLFKSHILEKTKEIEKTSTQAFLNLLLPKEKPNKASLEQLEPILAKTFANYKRVNMNYMMSHHCPLPKNYHDLKRKVLGVCAFYSKKSKDTVADTFNSLFDNCISYENVFLLLKGIINKTFPREFLGEFNQKILYQRVKRFVQMKRFETFLVQDLVLDFDGLKLPWLKINWNKKWASKIRAGAKVIMEQIVIWLFNDFLIPFIRCNFYVTERHGELNQVFYYRKPLWKLVSKLAIKFFEDRNLVSVQAPQQIPLNLNCEYPISKLRILPKKDSFRPIMTFFRKPKEAPYTKGRKMTMNQLLTDSHIVLRTLKAKLGKVLGFAVFDNFQIFEKYQEFSQKWAALGRPKLDFVTMDIKKCYDSIDTTKLLAFLKQTDLLDDEYMICRYGALFRNKNQMQKKDRHFNLTSYFNYKERVTALKLDEIHALENHFKDILQDPRKAILCDLVQRKIVSKNHILKHLSYICEKHLVLYENKFYLQKRGIPQGLNISAILSSFYYASLEEKYLHFLREDTPGEANLLMRLTDDYLFVTTNREKANRVIESLLRCAKDNNFEINEEKLKSTLSLSIESKMIGPIKPTQIPSTLLKWCGKIIFTETFEIRPAFEIEEAKMYYSVNVKLTSSNVFEFLKNKLKSFLLNHSHFFINPHINSRETIKEILKLFLQAAIMKIYAFFEELRTTRKPIDFQLLVTRMTKYSLEDFVHNCIRVKGLGENINEEKLYLKICYEEFMNFFAKKKSNYTNYYNQLKRSWRGISKACQLLNSSSDEPRMEIENISQNNTL